MRQIALIPSGCNKGKTTNVATSDAKYLYFASTLAVYVMNKETFAIEKILSSSERPIRDITVSPHGNNFLATSSVDGIMTCWNVETEEIYCQVRSPVSTDRYILDWDPHTPDRVLMVTCVGVLKCSTWTVADDVGSMTVCFQLNKGGSVGTAAKWNPRVVDQLAIGTSEGHVILFDVAKKQKGFLQAGSTGLSVVDLQWDRLSSIYLLVAYQNYVSLWDTEAKAEMHVFESQGTRITSIGWLDWTAGNFISTNALTGVVKVWNASQKAPLDTLRVTNSGVLHCHMEAGSHRALMSCGDGNFQVYNLTRKRVEFDVGAGHTETIFDTVFSNTNPDLFASCSYDGTIKLWNTSDQRLRKTIHIADTAIYKLSWNHNDSIIACCRWPPLHLRSDPYTRYSFCQAATNTDTNTNTNTYTRALALNYDTLQLQRKYHPVLHGHGPHSGDLQPPRRQVILLRAVVGPGAGLAVQHLRRLYSASLLGGLCGALQHCLPPGHHWQPQARRCAQGQGQLASQLQAPRRSVRLCLESSQQRPHCHLLHGQGGARVGIPVRDMRVQAVRTHRPHLQCGVVAVRPQCARLHFG